MHWNRWVRQTHRLLSVVFTTAVIVNVLLNVLPLGNDDLVTLVGLLTLLPLTLLMITGLYLFVLPYVTGTESRPRSDL